MIFSGVRDRAEGHVRKNVLLQIDPRCDLGQLEPGLAQFEYASLGDVQDHRAVLPGESTTEGPVLHGIDELRCRPVVARSARLRRRAQAVGGEGADKDDLTRVLRDIDEAARPGQAGGRSD